MTQLGRTRNQDWMPGLAAAGLAVALALSSGCGGARQHLNQALLADRQPAAHAQDLAQHYRVRSSDVLDVQVSGRPDCCGSRTIRLDGRIALADHEIEVEGRPTSRIATDVAREVGVPEAQVQVKVREYNSQYLYLSGEIDARHQVLPYRGPETIVDLLQRIGGVNAGAALGDVRVVRGHVADGLPPEVFRVDLHDIVVKKDQQTNIRLEPSDHIYIGQSRRSHVACQLPPWLQRLCRCGGKTESTQGQANAADAKSIQP